MVNIIRNYIKIVQYYKWCAKSSKITIISSKLSSSFRLGGRWNQACLMVAWRHFSHFLTGGYLKWKELGWYKMISHVFEVSLLSYKNERKVFILATCLHYLILYHKSCSFHVLFTCFRFSQKKLQVTQNELIVKFPSMKTQQMIQSQKLNICFFFDM